MSSLGVGWWRLLSSAEEAGNGVEHNHLEENGAKQLPARAPAAGCGLALCSLGGLSLNYCTTTTVHVTARIMKTVHFLTKLLPRPLHVSSSQYTCANDKDPRVYDDTKNIIILKPDNNIIMCQSKLNQKIIIYKLSMYICSGHCVGHWSAP